MAPSLYCSLGWLQWDRKNISSFPPLPTPGGALQSGVMPSTTWNLVVFNDRDQILRFVLLPRPVLVFFCFSFLVCLSSLAFFRFFSIVISYFDFLDSGSFPYGLHYQIVELCVLLWWVLFVFPGYFFVVFSPSLFVVYLVISVVLFLVVRLLLMVVVMVLWSLSALPFSLYMPISLTLISSTLFAYCFETKM